MDELDIKIARDEIDESDKCTCQECGQVFTKCASAEDICLRCQSIYEAELRYEQEY